MKVYISGALKASTRLAEAKVLYEKIGEIAQKQGFSAYIPHKNTDPVLHADRSPLAVFEADYTQLMSSRAVISVLNEPSLGVGAEIAMVLEKRIPILAIHDASLSVSRFVGGLLEKAGYPVQVYASPDELAAHVHKFLKSLN